MRRVPCAECGKPTSPGPRCPAHTIRRASPRERGLDAEYQRNRRLVLLHTPEVCWLCGQGPRLKPNGKPDKWTVDHILPRANGGGNELSNLARAHESCNIKRRHNKLNDSQDPL